MSSDIKIVPLTRKASDVLRFLKVSYGIYRDDPHWVAPLLMDLNKVFTDANPLFGHAEMALWVAVRNGQDVGRIAGILDRNHNQTQADSAAFFGFFESVNDAEVSRQLFDAVFAWARQQGARRLLGPMNPTTNDECGLLVDGFDSSPVFMMTYNPPYYADLVAAEGFTKAKDLFAYTFDLANAPLDRFERVAGKLRNRGQEIAIVPVTRRNLKQSLAQVKEIY
ncbi:MAG: N-acetyltransferase, partial [Limisphaerales bacterium]